MGRFGKKDPKLSEVKAVLQRLQGLPAESEAESARPASSATAPVRPIVKPVTGAIVLASAVGLFGAAYMLVGGKRTEPAVAPSPPESTAPASASATPPPQDESAKASTVKATLEGARALMSKGRVRAAREQLLALAEHGSPDAAWDLARSYDPNVLVALPAADAGADVKEATRWYRAWYAAAVQQGLVADSVSLERIIGSMQK
jgi:hypothetical protein